MLRMISMSCLLTLLFACSSGNDVEPAVTATVIVEEVGELILVTGVTGKQGGAVARALLDDGYQVRGLTRNADSERALIMQTLGVELVTGDFENTASLDIAMKDVHGVFVVTNFWEHGYEAEVRQGKNAVDAALAAGVAQLVFSSVIHSDLKTGIAHFESKYEIEKYILSKDIPYTIFRPVSFMENWEYARAGIVAGKINSPFSLATRMQQISVIDIGRFVALAFNKQEDWLARTFDIASEEYTMKQAVNLFSVVTASPVEFVQTPWDVYEREQGEEMTVMDRWINTEGYNANINMARMELPDMLTLEEYLLQAGW